MPLTDILASAPLFSRLSPPALSELAGHCSARRLDDGSFLFHANEPADRLYVLAEGGLEVVRFTPGADREIVLNTLAPGSVVGELAILRGEARSASVRARGPTLVHGIEAETFLHYVRRWPELAMAIARGVAESFVLAERRMHEARAPLWLVVASPSLDPAFAVELAHAALPYLKATTSSRRAVVLAAGPPSTSDEDGIHLEVSPPPDDVHALAARAAEEVKSAALVVVAGPRELLAELGPRCGGVIVGPGQAPAEPPGGARWIELTDLGAPSATRVRRRGLAPAVVAARVARLLLRRSIGVALGGGAGRGLVQLGILEVVESIGISIDFLAGTSIGSMVGAFYLANGLAATMDLAMSVKTPAEAARTYVDPSVLVSGILEGRRLVRFLERNLAARQVEELPIPFAAISLDIDSGDEHRGREGRLADVVRASVSIPGLFVPYVYRPPGAARPGRFVDGGVTNLVPVDAVRSMGADRVIGVHVAHRPEPAPPQQSLGWRRRLTDGFTRLPTIARALTVVQSQLLGLARMGERQVFAADVAVMPDASAFGFTEIWRAREMFELGRRAAWDAADQLRLLTR